MARFSIRWLLVAVVFVAIACAALKYAGPVSWAIVSMAAILLLMGSTIVAFVGIGQQRAKATGCAVCLAIYGALMLVATPLGLVHRQGRFPTTMLMLSVAELLPEPPEAHPKKLRTIGEFISSPRDPSRAFREEFMRVTHVLWAILFGFLGSVFAGFVYRRSHREAA